MKRVLLLIARLSLGLVFLVAGALKLHDPAAFAQDIVNYQLFPSLAPVLAVVLPGVEVVVGLALLALSSPWRRSAALMAAALMVVFTFSAGSALARGLDVSCGCFGGNSGVIGWTTIARDVALLAAAALVLTRDR
jgi:putative oxidoreductase